MWIDDIFFLGNSIIFGEISGKYWFEEIAPIVENTCFWEIFLVSGEGFIFGKFSGKFCIFKKSVPTFEGRWFLGNGICYTLFLGKFLANTDFFFGRVFFTFWEIVPSRNYWFFLVSD